MQERISQDKDITPASPRAAESPQEDTGSRHRLETYITCLEEQGPQSSAIMPCQLRSTRGLQQREPDQHTGGISMLRDSRPRLMATIERRRGPLGLNMRVLYDRTGAA
ncbi:unnamed protein product [Symbiodinium microadriaticum]|nr:unnamed protein product [Symbiodinium microadriaticum]